MAENGEGRAAFRQKSAEIAVAAFFLIVGVIVIVDSRRLGMSWGNDGPLPGYFPFYVGLLMCVGAAVSLVSALRLKGAANKPFVMVHQLKMVLSVLVPTAIYALGVTWIGIYVSSIVFIGFFMRWLGGYPWWKVAAVSVGVVVVFYCIFELWFKVPLPKGPLENLLGLA